VVLFAVLEIAASPRQGGTKATSETTRNMRIFRGNVRNVVFLERSGIERFGEIQPLVVPGWVPDRSRESKEVVDGFIDTCENLLHLCLVLEFLREYGSSLDVFFIFTVV
jgi:hypothetical protein